MGRSGTILVTGGAGYIGSHTVLALRQAGYPVVVIDDLSTGNRSLVPPDVPFHQADAGDLVRMRTILGEWDCRAVIHFAGSVVVPESVADPLKYYRNNTAVSRALLEACAAQNVGLFIFSSTAAVYGQGDGRPLAEDRPPAPLTPYGTSKLVVEWMLRDTAHATALRYMALRYFNVAGADPDGRAGQCVEGATHLIKVACEVATGKRAGMSVFGTDYDTPDGTCVRDFIHVSDLAEAHVAALRHLDSGGASHVVNCGYGHGASVRQVLDVLARVAGRPLPVRAAPRRAGDAASVVASNEKLLRLLNWRPRFDDLEAIVASALHWERRLAAVATDKDRPHQWAKSR